MEPEDIAEIVIDKVVNYCNNLGDTLGCLKDYSPNRLGSFIDKYLTDNERKILKKMIINSDTFWDDVKKEYEARWKNKLWDKVADFLANKIDLTLDSIIENERLDDASKVKRLKAYQEVLEEFGDVIRHALGERKPLSKKELYDWFARLGDVAFLINIKNIFEDIEKNLNYYKELDYYLSYYDMLGDKEKREMLEWLLENIGSADARAWNEERKLEALTNENKTF